MHDDLYQVEENLVATPMVRIPNHAPATKVISRVARAFAVRRRVGTRTSATRLLTNKRIARGICRSRIEYRLLAAVERLIRSMLTWPYFSDDLRVLAPYVDVCSRAS
jgi:hypothetical protein